MKLILRQYLASLKEREELDAILPDLLSELGFTVLSRPGRGTAQAGVDVAAVGEDSDGERKVFLIAIKRGDLTRQSWDGTPQDLRPTLNEVQDVYIPTKLPSRYRDLKIVICICLGGDIQEQVRGHLTGYEKQHTTEQLSFQEWTGDEIAEMLLRGVLREQILPKELRSAFRKAVAMVDEPAVAFRHFADLSRRLVAASERSQIARVRSARQLYICLWILFVWARDVDNVEAPYRASELSLLSTWEILRPLIGKRNKNAKALGAVFGRLLMLHLIIATELLDTKIVPHAAKRYAISMAVQSRSSADVNLRLFEVLSRIAMTGLWYHWLATQNDGDGADNVRQKSIALFKTGTELINANPCLLLPLCDHQAIDVALFLLLAAAVSPRPDFIAAWLGEMAERLALAVRTHGMYPCSFDEYRDIVAHPRERSDEYRQEAMAGSILIPLLAAWLPSLGRSEDYEEMRELKGSELDHCTLQLWLPGDTSEEVFYSGRESHGLALLDLELAQNSSELLDTVEEACQGEDAFTRLSAIQTGYWPIILLACRHHRLPIPPQFWIDLVRPTEGSIVPDGGDQASNSAEEKGSEHPTTEVE